MIHFSTIHFRSDAFIDLQLAYLRRFTSEPMTTWAGIDGIDRARLDDFDRAFELGLDVPPSAKLDRLGELMLDSAADDDLIVFTHGDCFPIADWVGPVREMLARVPLVAVRRDDNYGEPMPHPCFTVTTAGFWRELGSSWAKGPEWEEPDGRFVTDVGATLWADLEAAGIAWEPLLRSNAVDLHPLWFGVYGGLVYHHGAGFRRSISRADAHRSRTWPMPLRRLHWGWRMGRNGLLSRRVLADLSSDGRTLDRLAGFPVGSSGDAGV